MDANKENLVITDSKGGTVSLSVDALGETIAKNDVFVTNLTENKEFITKLGDNNEFIKQIIKNIEKEAIPGTVTVIEKDGDFVFKWKTKDNQDQESSLTDFIKEHSVLASLTLKNSDNTNKVKAGFVFNNGANNAADIVFAETLTEIQKGYSKHQVNQEEIKLKEYYFIDETREKDPIAIKVSETIIDEFDKIVKFDNVKNILIDFVTSVGGDVSVKKEGEDLVITTKEGTFKVSDVVNAFETNTTITPEEYMVFVYLDEIDGEDREVHTDVERDDETFTRQYKAIKYVYTNEKGQKKDIKGSELFGQMGGSSGGGFETLTELMFDKDFGAAEGQPGTGKAALVYKDEEKVLTPIYISDMFKESAETLTSLAIDENANSLVYKDERGTSNYVSLNDINQEPWYTGNDEKATKNDQDIYTMGWVGIGYKDKSGAPNEKLRVNGSITATNSYYADYVFESYFDGYSTLKYDYKFNDLNTVDSYIKSNRHLPGITPISDLEKTETGYSFNVSELSIQLLEKTEELFLHVIDQQKELNAKDKEIQDLKNDVNDLAKRLEALEALLK
ncbi:hypothetical protein [Myroides odoratimimus]|uniref:hypothetical protein n=1 Tax=Myroides odoratimimus TaxID=76832 RepID=UPI0031011177